MVRMAPVKNEVGAGEQFPEGEYLFELVAVEPWVAKNPNPQFNSDREQLVWKLKAVEALDTDDGGDAFVGREIWHFTGNTMGVRQDGSKTKDREAYEAFLGRELDEDEEVDTDEIIGCTARGDVGRSTTGKHKVTRLRRVSRRAQGNGTKPKPQPIAAGGRRAIADDDADPWDEDE
jgi:hypothetical protein